MERADTPVWDAYARALPSLLDAVGRTPLVRLSRVGPEGLSLLAKIEWYGPTGSTKDRIYRHMIDRAEERGDLRPGMTIVESTTGNAGIACSAVAAIKGYDCVIVMPRGMSLERKKMIEAYGAEHELTPGAGTDIDLAIAKMREIVATDPERYFVPGEFENPDNPDAQTGSGEEIWQQCGGQVDAVVAAQGTGGWITGVARALKAYDRAIRAYAVEPAESPLISEQRWGTHGVPGIGDGIVTASTEEALELAHRLAREEGILAGPSGGINVASALKVAEKHPEFATIVTVVPDTGQRYLSGELFGEPPDEPASPERDHSVDADSLRQIEANRDRLEFIS